MALITVLSALEYDSIVRCSLSMYEFLIGYLIILLMILILEFVALIVSCRGSVLNTEPRKFLEHIIYSRLILLIIEFYFIIWGIFCLERFRNECLTEWYNKRMRQTITGKY